MYIVHIIISLFGSLTLTTCQGVRTYLFHFVFWNLRLRSIMVEDLLFLSHFTRHYQFFYSHSAISPDIPDYCYSHCSNDEDCQCELKILITIIIVLMFIFVFEGKLWEKQLLLIMIQYIIKEKNIKQWLVLMFKWKLFTLDIILLPNTYIILLLL